jgi:hypothetical protein
MRRENRTRAFRGKDALKRHRKALADDDSPAQTILTDLLTDLMHYTDANGNLGVNFNDALRMARAHYIAEGGSQ